MSTALDTLTAREFCRRPDPGHPEELIQGRIVTMPPPSSRHEQICGKIDRLLGVFADENDLGHVLCNDSGVITGRDPDTVRGADVAYYSYARVPKGPISRGYLDVPPDLVVEGRSPDDRRGDIPTKVDEYLRVGVGIAVVLDPEPRTAQVFRGGQAPRELGPDDELAFPDLLGAFRVVVRKFFE